MGTRTPALSLTPASSSRKYSLNIPPPQIAADGARNNKPQATLLSALVFTMVPNINIMLLWDLRINVIRLTLAITWPQIFLAEEDYLVEAAQVNGGVS